MFRLIVFLIAGLGALTTGGAAFDAWMDDNGLRAAFAGKTIQGHYASGKAFTEIYQGDGAIEYRERGIEYRGHWSLQAGSFCTIYHGDPTGGCYRVRQVSDNCYEFYFVARTEVEAAERDLSRPAWTARAAVSDRDATCADRPSV
jgi:hypothetical protein